MTTANHQPPSTPINPLSSPSTPLNPLFTINPPQPPLYHQPLSTPSLPSIPLNPLCTTQAAREAVSSRHRQVLVAVGGLLAQAGCYSGVHLDESRLAISTVGGGCGSGRPVLHFVDEDAPCGNTPCTLVLAGRSSPPHTHHHHLVLISLLPPLPSSHPCLHICMLPIPIPSPHPLLSDARTGPQTALLQAYTSLHPHVLALVVLVRAFARGQGLVDVGTPQELGHGVSSSTSTIASTSASSSPNGNGGSGLLSSYTWSILALHFLLHERYVPNLHCLSDNDSQDADNNHNHNNNNSSLLQSLSRMTSEQAIIALQQPVQGLGTGLGAGSGTGLAQGQGRGRGRDPVTYLTRLEETTPLALLRDMFQVGPRTWTQQTQTQDMPQTLRLDSRSILDSPLTCIAAMHACWFSGVLWLLCVLMMSLFSFFLMCLIVHCCLSFPSTYRPTSRLPWRRIETWWSRCVGPACCCLVLKCSRFVPIEHWHHQQQQ